MLYARLALSFNADRPVMLTLLGDTYEDMKQYDKAIEAYAQVPESSPLRANAEMEIAVSLQRLERKDEALKKLEGLIAREPSNYDAIVTLGNPTATTRITEMRRWSMTRPSRSSPRRSRATGASITTTASRMNA